MKHRVLVFPDFLASQEFLVLQTFRGIHLVLQVPVVLASHFAQDIHSFLVVQVALSFLESPVPLVLRILFVHRIHLCLVSHFLLVFLVGPFHLVLLATLDIHRFLLVLDSLVVPMVQLDLLIQLAQLVQSDLEGI